LVEPDLVEPDLVEPDLVEPDLVEPDLVEPDLVDPDLVDPDLVDPDLVDRRVVTQSSRQVVHHQRDAVATGGESVEFLPSWQGSETSSLSPPAGQSCACGLAHTVTPSVQPENACRSAGHDFG